MRRSTFERVPLDPSAGFEDPGEILAARAPTREEKERRLRSWRQDADRLDGSEPESMVGGGPSSMLERP